MTIERFSQGRRDFQPLDGGIKEVDGWVQPDHVLNKRWWLSRWLIKVAITEMAE